VFEIEKIGIHQCAVIGSTLDPLSNVCFQIYQMVSPDVEFLRSLSIVGGL
jgi:hypothetical protein